MFWNTVKLVVSGNVPLKKAEILEALKGDDGAFRTADPDWGTGEHITLPELRAAGFSRVEVLYGAGNRFSIMHAL